MMRWLFVLVAALGVLAMPARAEPYWIAYEGNDFPENEGWWHIWGPEPGERWIEDSVFVLDTLRDTHIADFYVMNMWGSLDPGPGETFVMPISRPISRDSHLFSK
jgi:hypothetical protein